jgi:hypothetical protein
MNSEQSQPTKCENYKLPKRCPTAKTVSGFLGPKPTFYHFLTVFCHRMGYATTPHMHHPKGGFFALPHPQL